MTVYEKMLKLLIDNGMFESQAREVLKIVAAEQQERGNRWVDDEKDYPAGLYNVLWLSVKRTALKWLNENAPQAWFKPMFE